MIGTQSCTVGDLLEQALKKVIFRYFGLTIILNVNLKTKFKTTPYTEFEIKLPRFVAKTGQNQSLLRTTLAITVISSAQCRKHTNAC